MSDDNGSQHEEEFGSSEKSPVIATAGLSRVASKAWRITAIYGVFATLWIYFSDQALSTLIRDQNTLIHWSVYKGLGFVAVTSVLLLGLMRKAFGAIAIGYANLQQKEGELQASKTQLTEILSCAMDAIITVDENRRVVIFNIAAEKMFDCPQAEALGQPLEIFVPGGFAGAGQTQLILSGLRKSGEKFPIEASVSETQTDERRLFTIILRDISQRLAHETEIEKFRRLYAALSQVNQAIVWSQTREELFATICRVVVEFGAFRMAWIGWHDPQTLRIMPVAQWGDASGYLHNIQIYSDLRPEGRGPTGTAFRENEPFICQDIALDPVILPWREEAQKRDFRSCISLPIREKGEVRGVLNVYADEAHFFQEKEVALLVEAASDISFALDNLAREEERLRAEETARSEQLFSDMMIESMPGVVYFYDEKRQLLRWNQNFEIVSGYSKAEIAGMNPLQFFQGEDKERVQERIEETFARGEAFVEAHFVSKDGRSTPYFFTGKRIILNEVPCLIGMGVDISERKATEAALRESQESFRTMVDSIPQLAWMARADGSIFWYNRRWHEYTATTPEQMEGLGPQKVLDAAVLPAMLEQWKLGIETGQPFEMEFPIRRGDGVFRTFLTRVQPLKDSQGNVVRWFGTNTDVDELKRTETALRHSEELYRYTLDNILEGCQIIGYDWRYLFLNQAADQHNRQPSEHLLGNVVTEMQPGLETTELYAAMRDCMEHRVVFRKEIEYVFPDESRGWFDVCIQPAPDGIYLLSIDITERHRAEMALRELNETLEAKVDERTAALQNALARAEAADRIKSAFLATMSHELRTPLNSIIGFTGIILQGLAGPLNAEQSKQLGMVRGSARHLLELINDVLDISKIEAQQLEVRAEPFDLRVSIERVLASVRPMAQNKGLELIGGVLPPLETMISDRRRVEQVLLNLLNNAVKFTDHGKIELSVEIVESYQQTESATPTRAVRLQVIDSGIGIRPDDLKKLFQPFQQIDTGLAREHDGTGLGLAICRRLAELMGGEVTAESQWAKGSCFTAVLPLQKAS